MLYSITLRGNFIGIELASSPTIITARALTCALGTGLSLNEPESYSALVRDDDLAHVLLRRSDLPDMTAGTWCCCHLVAM